jgi:purine-binding chemotaxis protein CheW
MSETPEAILQKRARKLARPVAQLQGGEKRLSLLEFRLGPEAYAIEARHVREVVPTNFLAPLPGVPPFVLGIVSVRGLIWSVMDLRVFFSIPKRGISDHPRAILVEAGGLRWGILADSRLRMLYVDSLRPPPEVTERIPRNVVRGTTDDLAVVLDLEVLARDPRMIVQEDLE